MSAPSTTATSTTGAPAAPAGRWWPHRRSTFKLVAGCGAAGVLGLVAWAYFQPALMLDLANSVWRCM